MAISVTWPTGVIFVPEADTVLTGTDPISGREIRSFDTDQFRKDLRDLEDDQVGRAFPRTHDFNAAAVLGGITFVPVLVFINDYTVEFEDGTYRVVLEGTNNNIADVSVVNNVSIQPTNSAGLITIISGSGLDVAQTAQLLEMWQLVGLDAAFPMTVTPSDRKFAGITQDITGDGETTSTVTRL